MGILLSTAKCYICPSTGFTEADACPIWQAPFLRTGFTRTGAEQGRLDVMPDLQCQGFTDTPEGMFAKCLINLTKVFDWPDPARRNDFPAAIAVRHQMRARCYKKLQHLQDMCNMQQHSLIQIAVQVSIKREFSLFLCVVGCPAPQFFDNTLCLINCCRVSLIFISYGVGEISLS